MKNEYRRVNIRTTSGLIEAERLQADGWLIGSSGPLTIQFYRPVVIAHSSASVAAWLDPHGKLRAAGLLVVDDGAAGGYELV